MNCESVLTMITTSRKPVYEVVAGIKEAGVRLGKGNGKGFEVFKDQESGVIASFSKGKLRKVVLPKVYDQGFLAEDFTRGEIHDVDHDKGIGFLSHTITNVLNGTVKKLSMYVENGMVKFAAKRNVDGTMEVGSSVKLDWLNSPRKTDNYNFEFNGNSAYGYKKGWQSFIESFKA